MQDVHVFKAHQLHDAVGCTFCRPHGCGDPYVVAKMDSRLRRKRPSERPSHWEKVLGGLEEHLASWTKGCEGQKGSGVLKRNTRGGKDRSKREGRNGKGMTELRRKDRECTTRWQLPA